jgi:hypothetical protein
MSALFVYDISCSSTVISPIVLLAIRYSYSNVGNSPIPVAARSKAWFCGRSLAGVAGSNPTGGHGSLSVVSVVCCLRRADHTSTGVLLIVVCTSVIMNHR